MVSTTLDRHWLHHHLSFSSYCTCHHLLTKKPGSIGDTVLWGSRLYNYGAHGLGHHPSGRLLWSLECWPLNGEISRSVSRLCPHERRCVSRGYAKWWKYRWRDDKISAALHKAFLPEICWSSLFVLFWSLASDDYDYSYWSRIAPLKTSKIHDNRFIYTLLRGSHVHSYLRPQFNRKWR